MTVRIGIIGVGGKGGGMVGAYQQLPEVEVVAVNDLVAPRAETVANAHGVGRVCPTSDELLSSDDVDLVYIGTPPAAHYELTVAAIKAGKHILCEKPLAMNVSEAEKMLELAEKAGVVHAVNHDWLPYTPEHLHFLRLLREGYVGEIFLVSHSAFSDYGVGENPRMPSYYANWLQQRSQGGGSVAQYFCHTLDMALRFFGEFQITSHDTLTAVAEKPKPAPDAEPAELYGGNPEVVGMEAVDVEDTVVLNGRLRGGGLVAMASTWSGYHAPGFRWDVFGSEGTLQFASAPEQMGGFPLEVHGAKRHDRALHLLDRPDDLQTSPTRMTLIQDLAATITGTRSDEPLYSTFADGLATQRLLDRLTEPTDT